MSIFSWLMQQLQDNQMLTGMVGATLTGGVLYQLRTLPQNLFELFQLQFTCTLTLYNNDEIYNYFDLWLSRTSKADKTKRLLMTECYDYDRELWDWNYTLGAGWHLIKEDGHYFLLKRSITQPEGLASALGAKPQSTMTITTLGLSQKPIRNMIDKAREVYNNDGMIKIFYWADGAFHLVDRKRRRSLDTVYIPDEQKERIHNDLVQFIKDRELYAKRGTPYRRGYCFEGPPGTGKTTLILALAGVIGRNVYIINPNSVGGDAGLMLAMNNVPVTGVAAIEDIDAIEISKTRDANNEQKNEVAIVTPVDKNTKPLTLSGLLNAIDGVASRDGRVLFVTTNHVDKLDPALMRPGRIDVRETIDKIGETDAIRMYRAFYPNDTDEWFYTNIKDLLPISPCDLQNMLIMREQTTNVVEFIKKSQENKNVGWAHG